MFNRRLIKIVLEDRPALAAFIFTLLCSVLSGVLIVLQAQHLSQIIQRAFLFRQSLATITPIFSTLLAIISLRAILAFGKEYSAARLALRMKDHLRSHLLQHLTELGPAALRRAPGGASTGEIINTTLEGVEALETYYRDYLPQVFIAVAVPLTILAVVFPIDWISALVLLLTAPLIPLFMILIGNLAQTFSRRQWQALSRMSAHFFDVLQCLTTLKIFNQARSQAAKIAEIGEDHRRLTMQVLRVAFLSAFSLEFLATLSTAVVAVGVGLRLLYGQLGFGGALCVLFLAPDFYAPLRTLGTRFHAATGGVSAAEHIFALLDTQTRTTKKPPSAVQYPLKDNHPHRITFERVGYSYGAGEAGGLKDISFNWQNGEKIALVGPSGAGKSTLTHLLLRFIEPSQGRICVDEEAIDDMDIQSWRSKIAWVPQNPYLFNASVEDNIRLTKPDATLEEVQSAAGLAHIDGFIESLPQGYRTLIGERGLALSAGQAQRIALARAFLKDDPWLLILDEAAANLDPHLQNLTADALDLASAERFAMTVAHRLSSAARADKVIVLDEGMITQEGNHTDLSRQDGLFRRMVTGDRNDMQVSNGHPPALQAQDERDQSNDPDAIMSFLPGNDDRQTSAAGLTNLMRPFILSLILGLAAILSNVGLMGASAYIISAAALRPSVADLQVAIVAVRFFGIVRAVFRYFERYVSHAVTLQILTRLRLWFYRALEPLAPARLLSFHRADLLTRIVSDINSLEVFYVRVFYPPIVALATAIIVCLLLRQFDLRLGLTLVSFMALGGAATPVAMVLFGRRHSAEIVQQRADLNAAVSDHIQGLADLLAAGAARRHLAAVAGLHRKLLSSQFKMGCLNGLQEALTVAFANLSAFTLLWMGIPLVESGQVNGVFLAVFVTIALAAFEAVQPLPAAAQHLKGNIAAYRRLKEVVAIPAEVSDPPHVSQVPLYNDLEYRNLTFTYPGRSVPALKEINLDIPSGRRLALVGESGSGKSTLLNLLLRFWEYHQGEIRLGGIDLRDLTQEEVRNRLALLNQPVELFDASIRENLLLANPQAGESDIVKAAQMAEIHDFITALPQGYRTIVGEGGARLSAGERQRIALARTFLRQSPILALDEPTANLDVLTEQRILDNIYGYANGSTLLIITHRLIRMEQMDEIIVMQAGSIVERGTHDSLISRAGVYAGLVKDQNDWFKNDLFS